jgi:hypothetical protein
VFARLVATEHRGFLPAESEAQAFVGAKTVLTICYLHRRTPHLAKPVIPTPSAHRWCIHTSGFAKLEFAGAIGVVRSGICWKRA